MVRQADNRRNVGNGYTGYEAENRVPRLAASVVGSVVCVENDGTEDTSGNGRVDIRRARGELG